MRVALAALARGRDNAARLCGGFAELRDDRRLAKLWVGLVNGVLALDLVGRLAVDGAVVGLHLYDEGVAVGGCEELVDRLDLGEEQLRILERWRRCRLPRNEHGGEKHHKHQLSRHVNLLWEWPATVSAP